MRKAITTCGVLAIVPRRSGRWEKSGARLSERQRGKNRKRKKAATTIVTKGKAGEKDEHQDDDDKKDSKDALSNVAPSCPQRYTAPPA